MAITSPNGSAPPVDLDGLKNAATIRQPRLSKTADPVAAAKTAKEFEAMFLAQMLQPMFAGLEKADSYFGGGHGEEAFKSMLVDEYGRAIANRGGLGIAQMVQKEILKQQELANNQPVAPAHTAAPAPSAAPQAAPTQPESSSDHAPGESVSSLDVNAEQVAGAAYAKAAKLSNS